MRLDFVNIRQFSWVAAGAAVVGAGVSIYKGIQEKKQAKSLMANNQRPIEAVPTDIYANQQLAQNMSLNGLPSEQYQQAQKNIQRQQAAAMGQAQDRRSGVANIGAIQQGTNDAYGNLDAANAAARHQNQLGLLGVNNQVAGWKDKVFDWNNKQKYIENQNYAMGLLGAGNQNLYSGIDKFAGAAFQAYGSGAFGGGGGSGKGGVAPASSAYDTGTANTGGSAGSPASAYGTLNPNSYSQSALIGG